MSDNIVLAEQSFSGFTLDATYGYYGYTNGRAWFALEADTDYRIVWDGSVYVLTSYSIVLGGYSQVVLGNKGYMTGQTDSLTEPFVILYAPEQDWGVLYAADSAESHSAGIYSDINITLNHHIVGPFYDNMGYGVPAVGFNFGEGIDAFTIRPGEHYMVLWDNKMYSLTAQDASSELDGLVLLGNAYVMDSSFEGKNEPFIICVVQDGGVTFMDLSGADGGSSYNIAIYQDASAQPDLGAGIILKNQDGQDVAYYGVETITVDTTEDGQTQVFTRGQAFENVPIELNFTDENYQLVAAPDGTLIKSAIIERPDGLIPEHIKKGIEVAGVEGNFAGDIVDKTIDLDFSNLSDMVVEADEDTVMSKVTIVKPDALAPENIAKDVNIAGVVGTHTCNPVDDPYWIDDVCFWDYDGTLILNVPMKDVKNLSELPTPPEHEGLVFREWNYTIEELHAAEYPRDVGAIYSTTDGKTHAIINITNSSNRAVPIYFGQTVERGVTINWGDGTTSTVAGTGVVNTTHTYSSIGTYEIVLTVSNGCTLTLGSATTNAFIGGSNSTYRNYLIELYVGDSVELSDRMTQNNSYLTILTIPHTVTSIPEFIAYSCYRLKSFIIPRAVSVLGQYNAYYLGNYNIENYAVVSIPETVETIGAYFGYDCIDIWRFIIPTKVTVLLDNTCSGCRNLRRLFMPNSITSVGGIANNCHALTELKLPSNLTSIGSSALYSSGVRTLVIPASVSTIGGYFASYSAIKKVVIWGTITSVGAYLFRTTYLTELILCTQTEVNDAIKELITKTGYYRRLYVPDSAVTAYKNALSSDYKQRIYPLSSYPYAIPEH